MSIRVMAAAVATAAGLAVVTCGPSYAAAAGHASPAATRAVQLTGVQLRAALLISAGKPGQTRSSLPRRRPATYRPARPRTAR